MITGRFVNRKQAGNRHGEEWYECDRCGFNYPRSKVAVQNGLTLCRGTDTTGCWDEVPGHSANMARMNLPKEEAIPPLPSVTEDL